MDRRRFAKASIVAGVATIAGGLLPAGTSAAPTCGVAWGGVHYATVQEGVDATPAGGTVTVRGTCFGDVSISKDIRIVGPATLNGGNTAADPGHTISNHGATVTLIGIEVTGGYSDNTSFDYETGERTGTGEAGGGIYNEGGSLTLKKSSVVGNVTQAGSKPELQSEPYGGGGIYNGGGSVTIDSSSIEGNTGSGLGGGIETYGGTLKLWDSTVANNKVASGGRGIAATPSDGGGIYNDGGSVTLTGSRVSGNSTLGPSNYACNTGGGIDQEAQRGGPAGSITLTKSVVSGNHAGCSGGGIAFGTIVLINSNVTENTAGDGGGIFNTHSLSLVGSSSVTANTAKEHGGGIFNATSSGAKLHYAPRWTGMVSANTPDNVFNE